MSAGVSLRRIGRKTARAPPARTTMTGVPGGGRAKLASFCVSFLSVGIVSFKVAPVGFAWVTIHLEATPAAYAATVAGLLVAPWIAVTVAAFRGTAGSVLHTGGEAFGILPDEDEGRKAFWHPVDAAVKRWYGWLFESHVHGVSYGGLTGGVAGASFAVIKFVPPWSLVLFVVAIAAVSAVVPLYLAAAWWAQTGRRMAEGLAEHAHDAFPRQADDDRE